MKRYLTAVMAIIAILVVLAGCSRTAEDKLGQTREYLETGQYIKAKTIVDAIVAADSTSPEAIYGKGQLDEYRALDWDALFKYIDAAPMRDGYLPAMKEFIELAIKLDYLENARRMTLLYIKRRPDKQDGYQYMAAIDVRESSLDSARSQLVQASAHIDDELSVLLSEAEIDFHTYDKTIITAAMGRLSEASFKSADQFRRLADLYEYLNLNDSTLLYRRKAVEKDERNVGLRVQLAQSLFNEKRYDDARSVVEEVLADARDYGPAQILRAYILRGMGLDNQAEAQIYEYMEPLFYSPLATEKHGDYYGYFHDYRPATNEWEAAYVQAANLSYPDDYLREIYLKMINGFLDDRDFAPAAEYYKEGEALLPNDLEMNFLKAEMQSYYYEVADSAKMFVDDQIQRKWVDARWLNLAGRYFFRRHVFDKAEEIYKRVMDLPYPRLECFTQTLEAAKENNDSAAADLVVKKLPYRFEGNIQLQELLWEAYAKAGKIERATHYAQLLYRNSNQYMPYILHLSDMYARSGQMDEARQLFRTFIGDFPQKADGYYQLARFDFDHKALDSVPALTAKSLAIDSQYVFTLELLGQYLQAEGKMDSAVVCYEKAVKLNGPTPMAYYNLAKYLYDRKEDLDRAGSLAMGAVRFFDNDQRGFLLMGKIYLLQEKYKVAKSQFYKGARLYPDNAEFHFLLGKTCAKLNEKDEARKALKQALKLKLPSPEKEEAQKILSGL